MDPVCLFVAASLVATLPQPEFTLAWTHSVEKTRWTERYRVEADALTLVEASVQGSGAGMEPAPGAVLVDGAWRWTPMLRLPSLTVRRSGFAGDYALCTGERCRPMADLAGAAAPDATLTIEPCARR